MKISAHNNRLNFVEEVCADVSMHGVRLNLKHQLIRWSVDAELVGRQTLETVTGLYYERVKNLLFYRLN